MYIQEKRNKEKLTTQEQLTLLSTNLEILIKEVQNINKRNEENFKNIDCKVLGLTENIHGNGKKGLLERAGILENTISVIKWGIAINFTILGVIISILGLAVSTFKMIK